MEEKNLDHGFDIYLKQEDGSFKNYETDLSEEEKLEYRRYFTNNLIKAYMRMQKTANCR